MYNAVFIIFIMYCITTAAIYLQEGPYHSPKRNSAPTCSHFPFLMLPILGNANLLYVSVWSHSPKCFIQMESYNIWSSVSDFSALFSRSIY